MPYQLRESVYWSARPAAPAIQFETVPVDDTVFDVIIVGAGYTGLNAAIELARAGRSVAVIDAEEPGSGASGRNAGHVSPTLGPRTPADLIKRHGAATGESLARWIAGSARQVFERIERNGIECEARPYGHLSLVARADKLGKLQDGARQWAAHGAGLETLDAGQIAAIAGQSSATAGGWIFRDGGALNPYLYAIGLAKVALASGARIFAHNRVTELEFDDAVWVATSEAGSFRGRTLLIATNGTPPDTTFALRKCGFSIECAMLASEPLDSLDFPGAGRPWVWADDPAMANGSIDAHHCLTVSVLVGRDTADPASTTAMAARSFRRHFPDAPQPRWRHHWRGRFLLTTDGLPRLSQLDRQCYAAFGCNGFGITVATLMGIELAKLALGREDELIHPLVAAKTTPLWSAVPWLMRSALLPLARRAN